LELGTFNICLGLIGQKSHKAAVFDRPGKPALMLQTNTRSLGRHDLRLKSQKTPDQFGVFIINVFGILTAKKALFHTSLV